VGELRRLNTVEEEGGAQTNLLKESASHCPTPEILGWGGEEVKTDRKERSEDEKLAGTKGKGGEERNILHNKTKGGEGN